MLWIILVPLIMHSFSQHSWNKNKAIYNSYPYDISKSPHSCSIHLEMAVKSQVLSENSPSLQLYISQTKRHVRGKTHTILKFYISSTKCKGLCVSGGSGFYETAGQIRPFLHMLKIYCVWLTTAPATKPLCSFSSSGSVEKSPNFMILAPQTLPKPRPLNVTAYL